MSTNFNAKKSRHVGENSRHARENSRHARENSRRVRENSRHVRENSRRVRENSRQMATLHYTSSGPDRPSVYFVFFVTRKLTHMLGLCHFPTC